MSFNVTAKEYFIPQTKRELIARIKELNPRFKRLQAMPKKQVQAVYFRIMDAVMVEKRQRKQVMFEGFDMYV